MEVCGLDGSRGMEGNIFPIKFFLMIPGIKLQLKPVAASGLHVFCVCGLWLQS